MHAAADPRRAILEAGAVFVGGVTGCQLLRRASRPQDLPAGSDVSALLRLPVKYDSSATADLA